MKYQSIIILLTYFLSSSIGYGQSIDSLIQQYTDINKNMPTQFSCWGDVTKTSRDNRAKELLLINESLTDLAIDSNIQQRINRDLLQVVVQDELSEYEWQAFKMPLNAEGGFIADLIYKFNGMSVTDSSSYRYYESCLNELPSYLNEMKALMKSGVESNRISPKVIVNRCIDLVRFHLDKPLVESLFMLPVGQSSESFRSKATQLTREKVVPAYQDFLHFLENEYLTVAPVTPGIGNLPDGKSFYENKVKFYTTLDMTPDQVYAIGEKEVSRIRSLMEKIIKDLNFEGSFTDFLEFLRTDDQFYVEKPQQLLHYAAWLSKSAESKLPQYFNVLPRNPFTVEPVPDALAPNYTGGRYSPGSYKRRKAGAYWVNTYNLKSRPLYVMPALTLHEAVPGHHLQGSLAQEIELSDFRRNTYLSAFGEGWALYTEYLGEEMGMYTTPYEQFGRLTYEMWRACRLVVDVGLHYKGWSREKAIEFMASNTALSMHEVNSEIDRYIGWPGQAVSYKIGELKIKELRQQYANKLGKDFDLSTFHDQLLKYGSMPLSTMEYIIERYYQSRS